MPDVSDLLQELADAGLDATQTRMLAVLNATYWEVCGLMPWPFLIKTATLTFNGSSASPSGSGPIPSDLHQPTVMQRIDLSPPGNRIKFIRYDDFVQRHLGSTTTGNPQVYYMNKQGQLNFWPIPTSDVTVQMEYISTPPAMLATDLEASIVIPKQFQRDVLVNGAVYRLDAMNDDTDIATWFQVEYQNTIQRMQDWCNRFQWSDVDIIHPVDSDDLNGGAANWGYGFVE